MRLRIYDSLSDFLLEFRSIKHPVRYFFSENFEDYPGVGLKLAALVKRNCGSPCYLIAETASDLFEASLRSGVIDDVCSVFPTQFFGKGE